MLKFSTLNGYNWFIEGSNLYYSNITNKQNSPTLDTGEIKSKELLRLNMDFLYLYLVQTNTCSEWSKAQSHFGQYGQLNSKIEATKNTRKLGNINFWNRREAYNITNTLERMTPALMTAELLKERKR